MRIIQVEVLGEQRSCVVIETTDRDPNELADAALQHEATQQMDGHEMVLVSYERQHGETKWLEDPDLYRLDATQEALSRRPVE